MPGRAGPVHHLIHAVAILIGFSVAVRSLAGVDLNDPSLETDEFWQEYYAKLSRQQQPLENNTWANVTVQAGGRAALSCRVKHLGSRPVSWIRRRDFHVLTSRSAIFTADKRFGVQHRDGPVEDWALTVRPVTAADSGVYECQVSPPYCRPTVRPVTAADSGVYECQVSTDQGPLSRFVNVTVLEPMARILGAEVHRIEEGSSITLLCVIDQAVSAVGAIQWWRDNETVVAGGRTQVKTSLVLTSGRPRSQLHVRAATFLDSGLYTCGGLHLVPATVQVLVTEGDKTAAIQRRGAASTMSEPSLPLLVPLLLLKLLEVLVSACHGCSRSAAR